MIRIIGIDVGGTNTNAVFLEDGNLITTAKSPTNHQDLLSSAKAVLDELIRSISPEKRANLELHLSTTLTTNAIVEGRGERTAVIVTHGPGMNMKNLGFDFPMYEIEGAIDHRGRETESLDLEEVRETLTIIEQSGFTALAVVGKFSIRNPQHELTIAELIKNEFPGFTSVTLGHRLSGRLNFPRRVTTAFLNACVVRLQAEFGKMVKELSSHYGINEPIFLLKADGGTMPLAESFRRPIETTLSGPAASIMGARALGTLDEQTTVTLDIGGTTTEIAVLVSGEPVAERDGAVIANYRTLIPALFSRSIGLGGDSRIYWEKDRLRIGPERVGPPVAMGGSELTPTDAVVALGYVSLGNREKTLPKLEQFAKQAGLTAEKMAERIITVFCENAAAGIRSVFEYLNRIPAYTVSEVLAPQNLKPQKLIGMGGPAQFFIPRIAAGLKLPYEVLPYAEAANAVGAAASRPTAAISLRADTALGKLVVPELDEISEIRHALLFDLKTARETAKEKAITYASRIGIDAGQTDVEISGEEVFNVVRGFHTAGRIFSLNAQVKPGLIKLSQFKIKKDHHAKSN